MKGGDSVLGHLINTYGERWTNFVASLTRPADGDGWAVTMIKGIIYYLTDLQKVWDGLSGFVDWLAYGGKKQNHVKGAWESSSASEIADNMAEQKTRTATLSHIYGGGATPGDSATAQAGANYVHAPSFQAHVTIVQGAGQSAGGIADQVTSQMDDWWDTKMRQASPLVGVPSP